MSINQSVSAVRRVFETLRFNQSHPTLQQVGPYRSNKLTLLLKPLFTGKAGKLATFVVLLTAYPGKRDYDEKRGTLKVRHWMRPFPPHRHSLASPPQPPWALHAPQADTASTCLVTSMILTFSDPVLSRLLCLAAVCAGYQERVCGVRGPKASPIPCHGTCTSVHTDPYPKATLDGHGKPCTHAGTK